MRTALAYAVDCIETGPERAPPPPPQLLVQARLAARNGISLDTVFRRYVAGFVLLGDFLIEEVEISGGDPTATLRELLATLSGLLDRLLAAVSAQYSEALAASIVSAKERRAVVVRRLLAGELTDSSALAYQLDDHHLGVIAAGPEAEVAIRAAATTSDRRLLVVCPDGESLWAWLGGRRRHDPQTAIDTLREALPADCAAAVGEPAQGLDGWRLTHRQALAALPSASRSPGRVARYADVALIAAAKGDEVLATSLHELYLAPLGEGKAAETLRETLRAYFASGRNVTSAAAALGLSRPTVTSRLRAVEECLDAPLEHRSAELELALRLEEAGAFSVSPVSPVFPIRSGT